MTTSDAEPLISLDEPTELSLDEYNDLLQQIQNELLREDCCVELLDAARYNDLDVLRALLKCHPSIHTHAEECQGNTALHMAAANGHVDAVRLLLQCGADASRTNQSGNTPFHWAAINGHQSVVDLFLQEQKVDVLQQNVFGRSILTEGFSSQNTDVVQSLLQHESASEERLMQSTTTSGSANDSVTHEFVFGRCEDDKNTVKIQVRELAIAKNDQDSILGQVDPTDDTTGLGIWAASLVCAQWMAHERDRFINQTVLELGAGCGVPGLTVANTKNATKVYLTDFNPKTVENLQYNIELNQRQTNADALIMNWQDQSTWPSEQLDYVIGSDLIYQSDMVPLLVQTLKGLLKPTGTFLYVAPQSGRQGHYDFLAAMEQHFSLVEKDAGADLVANPLASQDDDLCFLHFHELQSTSYRLYEFQWKCS